MTAKEYLSQAFWLDRKIDSKLQQVLALRELAEKTTSVMTEDVVSHTRNVCSVQDVIAKIVDLESEMNRDIDRLIDLKRDIGNAISKVDSPNEQIILEYRYLDRQSWHDIAEKIGLHPRTVFRLHEQGLRKIEKNLRKSESCQ